MKKSISLVLLGILVVTSQVDAFQPKEDLNGELRGAIWSAEVDEIKRLIKAGADVNHKLERGNVKGITPLFLACIFCGGTPAEKTEIIKLLIDAGANVNEKYKGMTVLAQAVQLAGDLTDIIKPLVAGGLDIDAKNISGKTPLHGAAFLGEAVWVEPLIENGADVNAKDDEGHTPLDLAIIKNHEKVADLLRKHGGISGKK